MLFHYKDDRVEGYICPRIKPSTENDSGKVQLRLLGEIVPPNIDVVFRPADPSKYRTFAVDVNSPGTIAHRDEIEAFTEVAEFDGVKFHSLTYQDLIVRMCRECGENHGSYLKYITERYL